MSTSTTPVDITRGQDVSRLWNRRTPTLPIITRERRVSAPPVMKSTPIAARQSQEEELLQLLDQLRVDTEAVAGQAAPLPGARGEPALKTRDASDEQLDDAIDALFRAQLAATIAEPDNARMQNGLDSLLQMFPHNGIAARKEALQQAVSLLKRMDGSNDAIRMAVRMLDEFVAAHANTDKEQTSIDAERFIEALHAATGGYPSAARNKLLVYQLWGAKKLGNFTMAKLSVELTASHVSDDDPETTAMQIERAADYIQTMPLKYRLLAATELYKRAPDDAACKLRALQAIANRNLELPDTIAAADFTKIVNQQIYDLRIIDAAST